MVIIPGWKDPQCRHNNFDDDVNDHDHDNNFDDDVNDHDHDIHFDEDDGDDEDDDDNDGDDERRWKNKNEWRNSGGTLRQKETKNALKT